MKPEPVLTLALHGTSRGFGYVVFEGPFKLHDWGTVVAKSDKNAVCLRKLGMILDRYRPEALLLEASDRSSSLRSERIAGLYRDAAALAKKSGAEVHVYPFKEVQACFRAVGATSRQEIAEAVGRSVEALGERVPKPRKPWDSDHRRMAVFCAAALVLTHFHLGVCRLFDDLRPEQGSGGAEG